ncbi:yrdC domain-containing protein, mitochondrial [Tetranychus urticae]|uniref:Threonylcarbamoyl-AMP synthase n=1 Tax=Tetranychus urticae TaxID=32264 RepID=T1KQJ8_TETUR|nr:yrdC domain-containing protein, mitochondrial [Tetranychus urticae]
MVSFFSNKLIPVHNVNGSLNVKAIGMACDLISKGGILGVPTDTIYGLIGLAQEPSVVSRIYQIKGRLNCKPIAICLSNVNEISKWSIVTVDHKILNALLPGPYTLIFERSPQLNPLLNPETNSIGIRIPDHPFILKLTQQIAEPLALTSANISDKPSCTQVDEFHELWSNLDAVLDGGKLTGDPNKLGSTVIDLSTKGYFKIIRPGCAYNEALKILETQFGLLKSAIET